MKRQFTFYVILSVCAASISTLLQANPEELAWWHIIQKHFQPPSPSKQQPTQRYTKPHLSLWQTACNAARTKYASLSKKTISDSIDDFLKHLPPA